jgi:hypothetical protein
MHAGKQTMSLIKLPNCKTPSQALKWRRIEREDTSASEIGRLTELTIHYNKELLEFF